MIKFFNRKPYAIIGAVCILSLIGNGYDILANYLAVSKYGDEKYLWYSMLLVIPALAFLLLIPISLVSLLFKRIRKIAFIVLIASILYLIIGFYCGRIGGRVRIYEFKQFAIRSKPLISAIYIYEKKYGHPPEKLENLVPEFLDKIPETGMKAYPKYEYQIISQDTAIADRWKIRISTPTVGIGFDEFIYYPSKDYPEKDSSGWYERVEDWAYYHE